jgi:hypothetical protein
VTSNDKIDCNQSPDCLLPDNVLAIGEFLNELGHIATQSGQLRPLLCHEVAATL